MAEEQTHSFLYEINPDTATPDIKVEGLDWFAIFNPKVKRSLGITLAHTLVHDSIVSCVRFSIGGKYLATGSNRSAQIYDAVTGTKIWCAHSRLPRAFM